MKKKIVLAVLLSVVSVVLVTIAADIVIDPPHKSPCDCLSCILDTLKQQNITNVVSLEAKKDHWVAEIIDDNGKRSQVIILCTASDTSKKKFKGPYDMKRPPQDGKPIGEIIKLAQQVVPEKVKEVKFR